MKTSINYKKLWISPVGADGGIGNQWAEISESAREGTLQFNGASADTTAYKNVKSQTIARSFSKGDQTFNLQDADLSPAAIAMFTGGEVSSTTDYERWLPSANLNSPQELSIKFLTDNNIVWYLPRVSFDAFPVINDDDLHYFTVEGLVLTPELSTERQLWYDVLTALGRTKAIIESFTFDNIDGEATIDSTAKTVVAKIASGEVLTAITPIIGVSIGADVTPSGIDVVDFTAPVEFIVEAADGTLATWTVTITVAV